MVKMATALALLMLGSGCMFEPYSVGSGNAGLEGEGGTSGGGPQASGGAGGGGMGGGDGVGGGAGTGSVIVEQPTCTPATEEVDCPATSCDPTTLHCSTFKVASRGACWTCVSDSDCEAPNHRCVEMDYGGERFPDEKHGFCLQVADVELELEGGIYEVDDDSPSDCTAPFTTILIRRASLSGGPIESYCGINEIRTTCFALRAFAIEEECPSGRDDECPAGGLCRTFEHEGRAVNCCTYECTTDQQCPWIAGEASHCTGFCGG